MLYVLEANLSCQRHDNQRLNNNAVISKGDCFFWDTAVYKKLLLIYRIKGFFSSRNKLYIAVRFMVLASSILCKYWKILCQKIITQRIFDFEQSAYNLIIYYKLASHKQELVS